MLAARIAFPALAVLCGIPEASISHCFGDLSTNLSGAGHHQRALRKGFGGWLCRRTRAGRISHSCVWLLEYRMADRCNQYYAGNYSFSSEPEFFGWFA
jgi:hypothetical protein